MDDVGGERHANAKEAADRLGLPWQFVEGIRVEYPDLVTEYSKVRNFFFYRRSMSAGEISVYLGHRKAWQMFLADECDFALILEDDFQVTDHECLIQTIRDASEHSNRWDIIKFFDVWSKKIVTSIEIGSSRLVCRKYPPNGAVGYLISRGAAEALLSRKPIYRPIDEDISRPWEFPLRVWSTETNLVTEISKSLGGSLLEEKRKQEEIFQRRNPVRGTLIRNILQIRKTFGALKYQSYMRALADHDHHA